MEVRITRTCNLWAAGLALAVAFPANAQEKPPRPGDGAAELTDYVRARAADADGASDVAASGYAAALARMPDDVDVALHAYRQGLAAGDYALAGRAAAALDRANVAPPDAAIFQFAMALKARDGAGIEAALGRLSRGPLEFMVPVLRAWIAQDRGQDPFALLDLDKGTPLARRYAAENHALLAIAAGRTQQALDELDPLLALGGGEDLRIDAGLLLAASGRKREAQALLAAAKFDLSALRGHGGRTGKASAAFGASKLFLSLAVDVNGEDASPLSILLTRSALLLDPEDDRPRLYLAEALSRSGSERLALEVLGQVRRDGPYARGAAAGAVAALRRAGETGAALARAKALAESADGTSGDAQGYGELLFAEARYDAAADAFALAIRRGGGTGSWTLHFLRGKALDRAGRWPEALAALRRSVELAPDQAQVLTYLGQAQVAHGEDLPGAQALLEHARRLRPEDGEVADSLGWAYFVRGDIQRALPMIEQAARTEPGSPAANEHLGDIYWKLGRRYEARYAWRAAAVYADADAAARIAGKVAHGLSAAD